jgi:hypothetical protein
MIIKAIFDTVKLKWVFETVNDNGLAERLDAILASDAEVTFVTHVKFGISVSNKEGVVAETSWPPEGAKWETTDKTPITNMHLDLVADTDYVITTWASINDTSDRITGTFDYKKPKPEKPYPSWTWDGNTWVAPTPSPATEDTFYKWDEASTSWVKIDNVAWATDYKDPDAKNPKLDT